jgi:hypothetical protein
MYALVRGDFIYILKRRKRVWLAVYPRSAGGRAAQRPRVAQQVPCARQKYQDLVAGWSQPYVMLEAAILMLGKTI